MTIAAKDWPRNMIRHIAVLGYAGMNATEIARELDVRAETVRNELKRMDLWDDARGAPRRASYGYRPRGNR